MTGINVDYENHPAFSPYVNPSPGCDSTIITALWAELDRSMKVIKESKDYLSQGFLQRYHESQINPLVIEVARIARAYMPTEAWFQDVVAESLLKTQETLYKEMVYENEKKQSIFPVVHGPLTKKIYTDLSEQGVSFTSFPQDYLDLVYNHLESERAEMEKMVHENPSNLQSLPLGLGGPYFQITHELLKAYGVLDGATLFSQQPLEIIYVALCLSCASQNWFRDCYADVGVETSNLAYLHFDHDFDVVKILMYLKPVTEKNGPFKIIPGSSKFISSRCQSVFFKHLDKVSSQKIHRQRQDLNGYYRPVFGAPDLRREFMLMPKELRGSSHFGDDILAGTSLSQELLAKEVQLLSKNANCAIFCGAETLHRGGLTEEGQRWAFQIALRKVGVGCGSA